MKKLIALLSTIVITVSFLSVNVFAVSNPFVNSHLEESFTTIDDYRQAASALADALFDMGLFVGSGVESNGAPIFELNRPLNRLEALTLAIRLMGLESKANEFAGSNPFSDTPYWGKKIAAFAYSEGITAGTGGGLFLPERLVTYQEFTAFLLRTLGYSDNYGDFLFEQALNKAVEINLFSLNQKNIQNNADQFLRSDAVVSMASALLTDMKDTDSMLIDALVDSNVISKESADRLITDAGRSRFTPSSHYNLHAFDLRWEKDERSGHYYARWVFPSNSGIIDGHFTLYRDGEIVVSELCNTPIDWGLGTHGWVSLRQQHIDFISGVYTFSVRSRAIDDNGEKFFSEPPILSPELVYSRPQEVMQAPVNLQWIPTKDVMVMEARWDEVEGAHGYTFVVLRNGEFHSGGNTFIVDPFGEASSYRFAVSTQSSDINSIADSAWSFSEEMYFDGEIWYLQDGDEVTIPTRSD